MPYQLLSAADMAIASAYDDDDEEEEDGMGKEAEAGVEAGAEEEAEAEAEGGVGAGVGAVPEGGPNGLLGQGGAPPEPQVGEEEEHGNAEYPHLMTQQAAASLERGRRTRQQTVSQLASPGSGIVTPHRIAFGATGAAGVGAGAGGAEGVGSGPSSGRIAPAVAADAAAAGGGEGGSGGEGGAGPSDLPGSSPATQAVPSKTQYPTRLESYLPRLVVEAYRATGMAHDLYQWQVCGGGGAEGEVCGEVWTVRMLVWGVCCDVWNCCQPAVCREREARVDILDVSWPLLSPC